MSGEWATRVTGWLQYREEALANWKDRFIIVDQGILSCHDEDPSHTAAPQAPRAVVDLVKGTCRVARGSDVDDAVRWPRKSSPENGLVVRAAKRKPVYLYSASGDIDKWLDVLVAAARTKLPIRRTSSKVKDSSEGFSAKVLAARDTGNSVYYTIQVSHYHSLTGGDRILCRQTYRALSDMDAAIKAAFPSHSSELKFPTSRVFRSKDPRAMPERIKLVEAYLKQVFALPDVLPLPEVRKAFGLKPLLEKLKQAGVKYTTPKPKKVTTAKSKTAAAKSKTIAKTKGKASTPSSAGRRPVRSRSAKAATPVSSLSPSRASSARSSSRNTSASAKPSVAKKTKKAAASTATKTTKKKAPATAPKPASKRDSFAEEEEEPREESVGGFSADDDDEEMERLRAQIASLESEMNGAEEEEDEGDGDGEAEEEDEDEEQGDETESVHAGHDDDEQHEDDAWSHHGSDHPDQEEPASDVEDADSEAETSATFERHARKHDQLDEETNVNGHAELATDQIHDEDHAPEDSDDEPLPVPPRDKDANAHDSNEGVEEEDEVPAAPLDTDLHQEKRRPTDALPPLPQDADTQRQQTTDQGFEHESEGEGEEEEAYEEEEEDHAEIKETQEQDEDDLPPLPDRAYGRQEEAPPLPPRTSAEVNEEEAVEDVVEKEQQDMDEEEEEGELPAIPSHQPNEAEQEHVPFHRKADDELPPVPDIVVEQAYLEPATLQQTQADDGAEAEDITSLEHGRTAKSATDEVAEPSGDAADDDLPVPPAGDDHGLREDQPEHKASEAEASAGHHAVEAVDDEADVENVQKQDEAPAPMPLSKTAALDRQATSSNPFLNEIDDSNVSMPDENPFQESFSSEKSESHEPVQGEREGDKPEPDDNDILADIGDDDLGLSDEEEEAEVDREDVEVERDRPISMEEEAANLQGEDEGETQPPHDDVSPDESLAVTAAEQDVQPSASQDLTTSEMNEAGVSEANETSEPVTEEHPAVGQDTLSSSDEQPAKSKGDSDDLLDMIGDDDFDLSDDEGEEAEEPVASDEQPTSLEEDVDVQDESEDRLPEPPSAADAAHDTDSASATEASSSRDQPKPSEADFNPFADFSGPSQTSTAATDTWPSGTEEQPPSKYGPIEVESENFYGMNPSNAVPVEGDEPAYGNTSQVPVTIETKHKPAASEHEEHEEEDEDESFGAVNATSAGASPSDEASSQPVPAEVSVSHGHSVASSDDASSRAAPGLDVQAHAASEDGDQTSQPGTPRSERKKRGLFSMFRRKHKDKASPSASPAQSPAASRSNASPFVQQAREFEQSALAADAAREAMAGSGSLSDMSASGPITNDPHELAVQLYKKGKRVDRKDIEMTQRLLERSIVSSTHEETLSSSLAVKQEFDPTGAKTKAHKSFKNFHAVLRGPLLMFYSSTDKQAAPAIGPLYVPSNRATVENNKKKGQVIRLVTLHGTFLLASADHTDLSVWLERLNGPLPLVLDCTHFISSETKDRLENFVSRTVNAVPSGDSVRVPVVMLGLRNAGKTTVVRALTTPMATNMAPTQPTEGVRLLDIVWSPSVAFEIKDVAGDNPDGWARFVSPPPFGIVYVVDSTDPDQFEDTREHLHKLLRMPSLRNTHFVIALNKQGFNERGAVECDTILPMLGINAKSSTFAPMVTILTCSAHHACGVLDILTLLAGELAWPQ